MKLGMILPIQSLSVDLSQLWEELREEVAVAEEAGFDAVFLPEFHQAHGGALVSPLLLGAGLLQGTTTIKFGSAVLATPLHHPVRLAEDTIMLDWITRGRVILGLGIGHQVPDFEAYGVDRPARAQITEEVIAILEKCFSGKPFTFTGEHFDVSAQITPRPFTTPRPPIWMGSHSDAGLRRAGQLADRWICDPERSVEVVAQLADKYRVAAIEVGRVPKVALFREGWVGESRAECERVWAPNALAIHRLYYNVGVYTKKFEPWVEEVKARADFTLDRLAPGRFLYGTPDEVVETLNEWGEITGADYVALRMRHPGGPSHAETLDAIRRFGAEVIPRIS
jgi:alkanesulfonate monooxygenase SsuD/methylene tetrahydromethanopterin reductase-like flavin-dependent oxidoreductase (luciferase family)